MDVGRTPYGVRGLKCKYADSERAIDVSHPIRGAWIEMCGKSNQIQRCMSHPIRGTWIEMLLDGVILYAMASRTPYGVRGLKYRPASEETP